MLLEQDQQQEDTSLTVLQGEIVPAHQQQQHTLSFPDLEKAIDQFHRITSPSDYNCFLDALSTYANRIVYMTIYDHLELARLIIEMDNLSIFATKHDADGLPYTNMWRFLVEGLSISADRFITPALETHRAWLYMKERGYGIESLASLRPTQIRLIAEEHRNIERQRQEAESVVLREIAEQRGSHDPLQRKDLTREEQQYLASQVDDTYLALARAQIDDIMQKPDSVLLADAMPKGEIQKPYVLLTGTYDPAYPNEDGTYGRLTGTFSVQLSEAQLQGMQKNLTIYRFRLPDTEQPLPEARLADHILGEYPPNLPDTEE